MRRSCYNRLWRQYMKKAEDDDILNDSVIVDNDGVVRVVKPILSRGELDGRGTERPEDSRNTESEDKSG